MMKEWRPCCTVWQLVLEIKKNYGMYENFLLLQKNHNFSLLMRQREWKRSISNFKCLLYLNIYLQELLFFFHITTPKGFVEKKVYCKMHFSWIIFFLILKVWLNILSLLKRRKKLILTNYPTKFSEKRNFQKFSIKKIKKRCRKNWES